MFEAKTHLSALLDEVRSGQVFFLTRRGTRVAELRPVSAEKLPLERGSAANPGYWMSSDFDETPSELEEYT